MHPYEGKEIYFSGFRPAENAVFYRVAYVNGMIVRRAVTKNLNYFVPGPKVKMEILAKASRPGITILSYPEFLRLVHVTRLENSQHLWEAPPAATEAQLDYLLKLGVPAKFLQSVTALQATVWLNYLSKLDRQNRPITSAQYEYLLDLDGSNENLELMSVAEASQAIDSALGFEGLPPPSKKQLIELWESGCEASEILSAATFSDAFVLMWRVKGYSADTIPVEIVRAGERLARGRWGCISAISLLGSVAIARYFGFC